METKKSFRYIGMLTASAILSSPLMFLSPVEANPFKFKLSQSSPSSSSLQNFLNDPNNLQWCRNDVGRYAKQIYDQRQQNSASNYQSSSGGGLNVSLPIEGIPVGFGGNANSSDSISKSSNSSSNYSQQESSEYQRRNCDAVLKTMGDVTIAEINANKEMALAKIQANVQVYGIDAATTVALNTNNTNLAIVKDTNQTNLAIANVTANAGTNNTLIGTIGGVLSTAIAASNAAPQQPPSVITATPNIQGINTTDPIRSMGFTPTNCNPSSAIIAIGSQGYCVQADRGLQSGMKYAYNSQTNSLSLLSVPSINTPTINTPTVTTPPVGVTDSRIALIQSWGFTLSRCSSTTAKISIDGQKALCVVPANGLKPGQKYSYNSETRSFKRIPSTTTGTNTVRTPQEVPPVRTNNGGNGF